MATSVATASAGVRKAVFFRRIDTYKVKSSTEQPLSRRASPLDNRLRRAHIPRAHNGARVLAVDSSPERKSTSQRDSDAQEFASSSINVSYGDLDDLDIPSVPTALQTVDDDELSAEAMRNRLEEYEAWANQREKERARVLTAMQDAAEKRAAEDARNIADSHERINELANKASRLQALRERSEENHVKEREQMQGQFEGQRQQLNAQIAKQKGDNDVLQEKARHMQAVVDARTSSLNDIKAELVKTEAEYQKAAGKHTRLEVKLTEITKYSEEMRSIVKSLEVQRSELEGTLEGREALYAAEQDKSADQLAALQASLASQRSEGEAEMAKSAEERASAETKLKSLQEVVETQTTQLNAALNAAITSGKQAVVSAKKSKMLRAEITELEGTVLEQSAVLEEQTAATAGAELKVDALKESLEATKGKLDELMAAIASQMAAAAEMQAEAAGEQEKMQQYSQKLAEVVTTSMAQAAREKEEVVGLTKQEVSAAVRLMDKQVEMLRRVAGAGGVMDPDPVGCLRRALEHGEEAAAQMMALDQSLMAQVTKVEAQAASGEFVRSMKEVVSDMREERAGAKGTGALEAEVEKLKATVNSLREILTANQ